MARRAVNSRLSMVAGVVLATMTAPLPAAMSTAVAATDAPAAAQTPAVPAAAVSIPVVVEPIVPSSSPVVSAPVIVPVTPVESSVVADPGPQKPTEPFAAALWQRLDSGSNAIGGETVNLPALKRFYTARNFAPVWKTGGVAGHEFATAAAVTQTLQDAARHGLNPAAYHGDAIVAAATGDAADPQRAVTVELLLSDGLLRYVNDVGAGRMAPRKISDDLDIDLKPIDAAAAVTGVAGAADPVTALNALAPQTPLYQGLVKLLADLREVERRGGWAVVPPLRGGRAKLEPGGNDAAMPALRNRLIATGDFHGKPSPSSLYDQPLKEAVARFQVRHGLDGDGVIGASTLRELNVPVSARVSQVIANLERTRWLPADLGSRYVLVNAPDFRLTTFAGGKVERTMRVIVGTKVRRTPMFSSVMTSVVLNPTWTMPIRLAKEDYLPKLRKNPNYLTEHGFTVYSGWGDDAKRVDPSKIDWKNIGASGIGRLKLREEPGPNNPLGRIKFNIRNDFDVYLHDTPNREKFGHSVRTFSSGCVRVGEPMGLADFVFSDMPQWDGATRQQVLDSLKTRFVILPNPIPVHLVYRTAWVDDHGVAQFRTDIYDRDGELLTALARTMPVTKVALSNN